MRATYRVVAATAVAVSGILATGGFVLAAGGGYGPTPPSNGAPGGFTLVAASKIFGPSGGAVKAIVAGGSVIVTVPPGAFPTSHEVVVTTPDLGQTEAALSSLGFSGYKAVGGVGVSVLDGSGAAVAGTFAKSLNVTLTGRSLGVSGERILRLTGPASAQVATGTLGRDSVSVAISSDPDLVAINPVASATNTGASSKAGGAGATSQHTGLPFTGEQDAAAVLAALGAVALAGAAVRHRRMSSPR